MLDSCNKIEKPTMEQSTMWHNTSDMYEKIFVQSDPRVNQWFLLSSHWPAVYIFTAYVLCVVLGPRLMEKREAFQLKKVLLVYNIIQVCWSFYMFQEAIHTALKGDINLMCEPFEHRNDPAAIKLLSLGWLFYLSKIVDLLDTVFFILKKKPNQVTFLHVFHHSTMVINPWLGLRHGLIGAVLTPCIMNTFVHTVMYSYYFLAALGPEVQKYLWWKKYLTQLQMTQFLVIIVLVLGNMYNQCPAPRFLLPYVVLYVFSVALLFGNFYIKTFNKKTNNKVTSPKGNHGFSNVNDDGKPIITNNNEIKHKSL